MGYHLITGGTGFIGCNLAYYLYNRNCQIAITGDLRNENDLDGIEFEYLGYDFHNLDPAFLSECDCVYHLAAETDTLVADPYETNLEKALELVHSCLCAEVPNLVVASSAAVYGDSPCPMREDGRINPLNDYALSKWKMECEIARLKHPNTDINILRFCNVYGPNERHKKSAASYVYQTYHQLNQMGRVRLFEFGNQYRDWVFCIDVLRALHLAGQADTSGTYNIGSGVATTFNTSAGIIAQVLSLGSLTIDYLPNPHRSAYQDFTLLDVTKAGRCLEWRPQFSLTDGMTVIHDYYQSKINH